jgi:hypothetical protein
MFFHVLYAAWINKLTFTDVLFLLTVLLLKVPPVSSLATSARRQNQIGILVFL